jgi:hypothetical protein
VAAAVELKLDRYMTYTIDPSSLAAAVELKLDHYNHYTHPLRFVKSTADWSGDKTSGVVTLLPQMSV